MIMQTIGRATRKELKQFLTVYQSIIEFSLEKIGLEVIIKYNKADPDEMLDDVNAMLINKCDEYLQSHNIGLNKYQLSTIIMDLYTATISSLDEPFKIIAKENKSLIQEYLKKNRNKLETLERIKKENESLDKEIAARTAEVNKQNTTLSSIQVPSVPVSIPENTQTPLPKAKPTKTKKAKYRGTGTADTLAMDNFKLPGL